MNDLMPSRVLNKSAVRNPEGLRRLARFLRLDTSGMSIFQIARLVRWRVAPARRFGGMYGRWEA